MRKSRHFDTWLNANWPLSLKQAWSDACLPGDAITPAGPGAHLAQRTRENAELALGRYIAFRKSRGLPVDGDAVQKFLDLAAIRAFTENLAETLQKQSIVIILESLGRALRLVAPGLDQREYRKLVRRYHSIAKPTRNIDSRLLPPQLLVETSNAMMDEAEADFTPSKATIRAFRNGLLILGATLCPLRRENWRMMQIGVHIKLDCGNPMFDFDYDLMKGRRRFVCPVPTEFNFIARLQRYIEHYRPLLIKPGAPDPGYLFLSSNGGQMSRSSISSAVEQSLLRRTKKRFSFHMFRYSAATFVSSYAPERLQIARDILHHKRMRTTSKHYVRGQQARSNSKYQELVRDNLRRMWRRKKSKSSTKSPSRTLRKTPGNGKRRKS